MVSIPPSAEQFSPPGLPTRPPEECKILVVDDDERIVEIFTVILKRDGYQVVTATDGYSAMRMIEEDPPDVAVLDVILPGLDGIEMCQRIKNDPKTRFVPVILVTGMSARARRLDGLRAGADDFLEKPPDPVELTVRVRSLLRTKQLYDEVEGHRRELEARVAERTQELRRAYERLQELSRVKANVISLVSHELRTPLHQAKIALALTNQEGMPDDQRETLHREAQEAIGLLEYRVADIEAFSDPTDLRLTPASARDLVVSAVEQVRSLRRSQNDDIEVDMPKGLPPIMVSPIPVTRAVAHVILNAVKFGDGKPVRVVAEPLDAAVRILVIDQGPGIRADLIPVLFEPLEQGDPSSTRRYGGLGIGLALVKVILDAHDITLSLQSEEGKGTVVEMLMPIANF